MGSQRVRHDLVTEQIQQGVKEWHFKGQPEGEGFSEASHYLYDYKTTTTTKKNGKN